MVTINDIPFDAMPDYCGACPCWLGGRYDKRSFCYLFEKRKNRYDGIPGRCRDLFAKAFEIGGDLVIVYK
jgi:hypothetical protein